MTNLLNIKMSINIFQDNLHVSSIYQYILRISVGSEYSNGAGNTDSVCSQDISDVAHSLPLGGVGRDFPFNEDET